MKKMLKIRFSALCISLLMVLGLVSVNMSDINALTMTEVLEGKEVVFYVGESVNIYDALQLADSRLAHLRTGCFDDLKLESSADGVKYYSIDGENITGIKAGVTTILLSGYAYCGQFDIFEDFNQKEISIVITKQSVSAPEVTSETNNTNGTIQGLDKDKLYEYSSDGVNYKAIPANSTNITLPKGKYYLRFMETDTTLASDPIEVIVKAPAVTPEAPVIVGTTDSSITIKTVPGQKYSIDNGATWHDGPVFSGLEANKTYTVIAKTLGVENDYTVDSATSKGTVVKAVNPEKKVAVKTGDDNNVLTVLFAIVLAGGYIALNKLKKKA